MINIKTNRESRERARMANNTLPTMPAYLFEIKKTQIRMLMDRGYEVGSEVNILYMTKKQFVDMYNEHIRDANYIQTKQTPREALSMVYTHKESGEKLYVYYASPKKAELEKEIAARFVQNIMKNKFRRAILISPVPLSSKPEEELAQLEKVHIQTFQDEELDYVVIDHMYQPKYALITDEEEENNLKSLSARNKEQLGKISILDPVIKYYDWPLNKIVKIYRNNLVQDTITPLSLFYRVISKNT